MKNVLKYTALILSGTLCGMLAAELLARIFLPVPTRHISLLLRAGKVAGRKEGRIWLVDIDDLKRYETEMNEAGSKKFDPTKNK